MKFGHLIKDPVSTHSDFWLLMYIDVLEFENRHFRKMFEGLATSQRRRFARYFERLKREGALQYGIDPAVGFTAAYSLHTRRAARTSDCDNATPEFPFYTVRRRARPARGCRRPLSNHARLRPPRSGWKQ